MTISGAELQNITAAGLQLGGTGSTGDQFVDSITEPQSNNIGTVVMDPRIAGGSVTFLGGASTFNALQVRANDGATFNVNVTTDVGNMTLDCDFDNGADEHAQFSVAFPKQWNLGTVTFQVFWTSTATDTDGVAWALQGVGVADSGTIDVAYGTAVVVTDDAISAAEDLYVTAESGAVTIAGTPADDELTFFRVFRDVSDANDDMTEDARLLGIKIFYTTDARDDT